MSHVASAAFNQPLVVFFILRLSEADGLCGKQGNKGSPPSRHQPAVNQQTGPGGRLDGQLFVCLSCSPSEQMRLSCTNNRRVPRKNWAAAFSSSSPHPCLSPLPRLQRDPEQLLTVGFCSTDVLAPPVWASVSCSCAQNWIVMLIWTAD